MTAATGSARRRPARSPDGTMTVIEHIRELRNRVVKAAIVIVLGAIVGYIFYNDILHVLKEPYCSLPAHERLDSAHGNCSLIFTGVLDGFVIRLKVAMIAGAILTSPLWIYQFWAFVTPGLKRSERKWTVIFVFSSTVLFACGAALAYFVLYRGLHILIGAAGSGTVAAIAVNSYLSFVVALLTIFGISFEFPLVIFALNRVGVLSFERLMKWQRVIVFLIFAFAAVATPTGDPFTMSALAVPMVALFEIAVVLARFHDKAKARRETIENFRDIPDDQASPLESRPLPLEPDDAGEHDPRS